MSPTTTVTLLLAGSPAPRAAPSGCNGEAPASAGSRTEGTHTPSRRLKHAADRARLQTSRGPFSFSAPARSVPTLIEQARRSASMPSPPRDQADYEDQAPRIEQL